MSSFELERIIQVKRQIIQYYNQACQAKKILSFETVDETDGTFAKVYFRPLVGRDSFTDPSTYPDFGSLGGTIARGEVAYFLKFLKENVEDVAIEESEFRPDWLKSVISSLSNEYNKISLLASIHDAYRKIIHKKEWNTLRNDVTKNYEVQLDDFRVPLYVIGKESIGSYIFILNKECCRMQYKLFHHVDLEIDSTLSVEIKPYEEDNTKMDILVHSTVKLDMCRSELAKIFLLRKS